MDKESLDKIEILERKILILENENEILKKTYSEYYTVVEFNTRFNQIIYFVIVFLKYLNNTKYKNAIVIGNFLRKLLEFVFRFNFIRSNISSLFNIEQLEFVYCNSEIVNKYKLTLQFIEEIGSLEKRLLKGEKIQIHNFVLENIKFFPNVEEYPNKLLPKITKENPYKYIPCYELYFYNIYHISFKIKVIIYAWKETNVDFSINNYGLGYNGFVKLSSSTTMFLNYLENIINSQTYFIKRPDTLQHSAFPTIPLLLEHKQQYLNSMYNLFKSSLLDIFFDNYEVCGITPSIEFETENDCPITGCSKPYPVFILECDHKVSFMAYKGIINKTDSELTQSIKCPYCRKDLIVNFHCKKIAYDVEFINIKPKIENKIFEKENSNYISKDSYENL